MNPTDAQSVIDFMNDLIKDPLKLRLYQRDPGVYLARDDVHLSNADKELLLNFSVNKLLTLGEVSTVMSLTYPSTPSSTNALTNGTKNIPDGFQVELFSRDQAFIAEKTTEQVTCFLLKHSSLHHLLDILVFDLHLCYTDPLSPYDTPYLVRITSYPTPIAPPENGLYNFSDVQVGFTAAKPLVLVAGVPAHCKLLNSTYELRDGKVCAFQLNVYPLEDVA